MSGELGYRSALDLVVPVAERLANPPQGFPYAWWPSFTDATGGMRGGELTIVCAPTGAGKTQLLANIACQLLECGAPTFVAPVETGDVDFVIRMLSVLDKTDWNTGQAFHPDRVQALLGRRIEMLRKATFNISNYDNRVAAEDMEAALLYQHSKYGVKVALLDNLNFFLRVGKGDDQNFEIDQAVRIIGNVAKKTGMHIFLICHPRKSGGEGSHVVSEYDIKGSGTIVQEAFNVILYNRPFDEDERAVTDRVLVFKKCRMRGTIYNRKFWFRYAGGRLEEDVREQRSYR